jgi:hypothetical protein
MLAVGLCFLLGAGCFIGPRESASQGQTTTYTQTANPTITIPRFSGSSGVIRIFNTTGNHLTQVTIGVRGFNCYGPTPTRTIIRTFNTYLRPGAWRSYSFTLGHRCQSVRAVTVGR